jgi:hypothetical protein
MEYASQKIDGGRYQYHTRISKEIFPNFTEAIMGPQEVVNPTSVSSSSNNSSSSSSSSSSNNSSSNSSSSSRSSSSRGSGSTISGSSSCSSSCSSSISSIDTTMLIDIYNAPLYILEIFISVFLSHS